jgi:hypothetical protein
MMATSLFIEVVELTEPYLGPAAHRFVSRQIAFHLGKPPEELTANDLPQLADWVSATLSLLTDNQEGVEEYTHRILMLGGHT